MDFDKVFSSPFTISERVKGYVEKCQPSVLPPGYITWNHDGATTPMEELMDNVSKWDHRFLRMADQYASWSKDPSSQIGCVVIDPKTRRILSGGYNGFPRGIDDSKERLENRELKYKYVVHAEMNAIYNATENGISLRGSTLYVAGLPTCASCALGVIQVGITRVVMGIKNVNQETWKKWNEQWEFTQSIFDEAKISHKLYEDW